MTESYESVVTERNRLRAIVKALEAFLTHSALAELEGRSPKQDPEALAAHAALTALLNDYLFPAEPTGTPDDQAP